MVDDTTLEDSPLDDSDETLAILTHVLGFMTWVIGPLVVYLVADDDDEFVKQNAAYALDWQIFHTVYMLASFILLFIGIGILGFLIFPLLDLVFCVIAAIKASEGETWKYPLTVKLAAE